MPRIAREIADGLEAVATARHFFKADELEAGELDLRLWKKLKASSPLLRTEMAEQLAPIPNAPTHTIRALACDQDPEIAGPVLERSSALPDVTIAEMARCKGDDHLVAIAARPNLDPHITSILARRGSARVLSTLAANETACFSSEGLQRMRSFLHRPTEPRRAKPSAGRIVAH
jgi:uncharacterized protein (DUF2336 family)